MCCECIQDVLPALTKALHSSKAETHVRALLALGMLVGNSQDLQAQLADVDGALLRILELRLQQEDEDSKGIADGIVAAMVSHNCSSVFTSILALSLQW